MAKDTSTSNTQEALQRLIEGAFKRTGYQRTELSFYLNADNSTVKRIMSGRIHHQRPADDIHRIAKALHFTEDEYQQALELLEIPADQAQSLSIGPNCLILGKTLQTDALISPDMELRHIMKRLYKNPPKGIDPERYQEALETGFTHQELTSILGPSKRLNSLEKSWVETANERTLEQSKNTEHGIG